MNILMDRYSVRYLDGWMDVYSVGWMVDRNKFS